MHELRRGQYMHHMTTLCLGVSELHGKEEANTLALINATKDKVFYKR